jgi:hypothetical protein
VDAVVVVIAHVITHETEQMTLVQGDDMVQNLAANASHPAFSGSVLPWRLDAGPLRFQSRRLQKGEDIGIEF